tara:strand:- start:81 stop:503 length:423 start_codon:yes stop_codon:yes gene_type:complete
MPPSNYKPTGRKKMIIVKKKKPVIKEGRKKMIIVKKKKPVVEKKPVKFYYNYLIRLRSFLQDYGGDEIKSVEATNKTAHKKIYDMEEKFSTILLKKTYASSKKGRELTTKQKEAVMKAIDYLDKLFKVDIKKGKTGLIVS